MPRQYTPRVRLICPACTKDFYLPPSMVLAGPQHCSRACKIAHLPEWARSGVKRGVYAITCRETGRAYIGSSVDVRARLWQHIAQLNRGASPHRDLQKAWDEFGANSFDITVIEVVCPDVSLFEREQVWMDRGMDGAGLLNSHPRADSPLGTILPPAARDAIANAKLGSRNPSAKLTDDDIPAIQARLASGEPDASIARAYGVTVTPIRSIKQGEWGVPGKRSKLRGPSRTLPESKVSAIRADGDAGTFTPQQIATRHQVNRSTVCRILQGKTHARPH